MNEGDMLIIQVPGSTANLGPGFDSIGLAVNLYLRLEVEKADKWEVIPNCKELEIFPKDERNYVVQMAMQTAALYNKELPPCKINMTSEIPLARGLGSSAAAIIAGIELANSVGELNLTEEEKFKIASNMEGHPDNVGASLYGGFVVGCQGEGEVDAVVSRNLTFELVAVIPKQELLTKESRDVLPTDLQFPEAVRAGAISNVMVAAFLSRNYKLAGKMMKKDLFHQPYRTKLVPHLKELEVLAENRGAFGVALSGAGPTVMCFCEQGTGKALVEKLTRHYPEMICQPLQIDQNGSQVSVRKFA